MKPTTTLAFHQSWATTTNTHVTSAAYSQTVDTVVNRLAVTRNQARIGDDQTAQHVLESRLFQMHLLADAIRLVASDDPRCRCAYCRDSNTKRRRERADRRIQQHTYLHPLIGRVNAQGWIPSSRTSGLPPIILAGALTHQNCNSC